MKKLIASAGIAALGVASLQAASQLGMGPSQASKPWSISASLRGFYDDNITTVPDNIPFRFKDGGAYQVSLPVLVDGNPLINPETGEEAMVKEWRQNYQDALVPARQSSYGLAFSPSVSYNIAREQTDVMLGYTFGLRWYEDREPDSSDESHQIALSVEHAVSPTLSFDLSNTLRVAQEPTIATGTRLRADSQGIAQPGEGGTPFEIRARQDYLMNDAKLGMANSISDRLRLYTSYANRIVNFEDPAFSGLLDRVEHTPLLHLLTDVNPNTVALLGYRFKGVRYTGDEINAAELAYDNDGNPIQAFVNDAEGNPQPLFDEGGNPIQDLNVISLDPSIRDSNSHYAYLGVDHAFTPRLQASARIGAQFTDFSNAPAAIDDNVINPFVDANISYGYAEGSNVQFGIKHERNRNDLAFVNATIDTVENNVDRSELIVDQEQTVLYGSVNHQFTARLMASLQGTYLNGSYKGGGSGVDGATDNYWAIGLNMTYAVNEFLNAELGYNFDDYDSGVLSEYRSYDRNRVYIGLRANY